MDVNLTTIITALVAAIFGGGAAGRLVHSATVERMREVFLSKEQASATFLTKDDAQVRFFTNESLEEAKEVADREHARIHEDIDRLLEVVKATSMMAQATAVTVSIHTEQINNTIVNSLDKITARIEGLVKSNSEVASLAAKAAVAQLMTELKSHG